MDAIPIEKRSAAQDLAAWSRAVQGRGVMLAQLCGVSRAMVYKWFDGSTPGKASRAAIHVLTGIRAERWGDEPS